MAVAQYIGARYVPMFYTNPDDNSNNWKAGVVYDPLTIVTDLAQSYTSKIPVPATIGRPSENPTYWIMTGAYSAQVEQYRQEVAQVVKDMGALDTRISGDVAGIDTRVDALEDALTPENECYLIISDSYGEYYGNTGSETGTVFSMLEEKLNMPGRLYFCAFTACGFVNNTGGGTFLQKLQAEAGNIAAAIDVSKISKVIVIAGRNDYVGTEASVFSAMSAFDNYVKQTYTKAKRYYGYIAVGNNTGAGSKADQMLNSYRAFRRCTEFGGIYLSGVECGGHVLNGLYRDGIHPTLAGKTGIANAVYEAIRNGSFEASYPVASMTITPASGYTFIAGYVPQVNEVVENNNLYIFQDSNVCGVNIPQTTFAIYQNHAILFANYSDGYLNCPFGVVAVPVTMHIGEDDVPARLCFTGAGTVQIRFYANKRYENITSFTYSGIGNHNVWPLVYC